jgi:hypothetical protein
LFWDNTNNRLGIGSSTPGNKLDVYGTITGASVDTIIRANGGADYVGIGINATKSGGTGQVNFFFQKNGTNVWQFGSDFAANGTKDFFIYDSTVGRNPFYVSSGGEVRIGSGSTGGTGGYWNTAPLNVKTSGNVQIGSTTDAGFKLDVNGTARVQGQITTTTANAQFGTLGASTGVFRIDGVNGSGYAFSVYSSSTLRFAVVGFGGVLMPNGFTIVSGSTDLTTTRLRIGTGNVTGAINIQAQAGNTDIASFKASNGGDQFTIKNTSGNVLIGTSTDIASSKVTIQSTTQGFLPPRMTTAQKNAIATPAAGLVVYDTTLNKLCVRTASAWETITSI